MSNDRTLLILHYDELAERLRRLFVEVADSKSLRDLILRDPVGTLMGRIFPGAPSPSAQSLSAANRLLFALLSNKEFEAWATAYEKKLKVARPTDPSSHIELSRTSLLADDDGTIYQDFVEALTKTVNSETMHSVLELAGEQVENTDLVEAMSTIRTSSVPRPGSRPVYRVIEIIVHYSIFYVVKTTYFAVRVKTFGRPEPGPSNVSSNYPEYAERFIDDLKKRAKELQSKSRKSK